MAGGAMSQQKRQTRRELQLSVAVELQRTVITRGQVRCLQRQVEQAGNWMYLQPDQLGHRR
jgi:hypothetical protein